MVAKFMKLGEILIKNNHISNVELHHALQQQNKCNSNLGKILVADGVINYLQLYNALAEQNKLEFVNLVKNSPDTKLFNQDHKMAYKHLEAVPYRLIGNVIIIATCNITEQLVAWAKSNYKEYRFVITSPYDINYILRKNFRNSDVYNATNELFDKTPLQSAAYKSGNIWKILLILLSVIIVILYHDPAKIITLYLIINIFYTINLSFKMLIFTIGYIYQIKNINCKFKDNINDQDLPIYTILIPLYKETTILKNLIKSIKAIDYPKSKLDIKIILEEDDLETQKFLKLFKLEYYFDIVIVPYHKLKTKAKALNYALTYAKGDYVTVYDAEDTPDPKQLKKAYYKFKNSSENLVCVQARLRFYNRDYNLLTKMFSIEYIVWFEYMLKGLELIKFPIPLGGTSNHFIKNKLIEVGGWDPYNVTEDADLGLRFAAYGYKTCLLNSVTEEEAPIYFVPWLKQRSRWIKGYFQTYIVHMRSSLSFKHKQKFRDILCVQFFIGANSLNYILNPFIIILSILINYEILGKINFPNYLKILFNINLAMIFVMPFLLSLLTIIHQKWSIIKMFGCLFSYPFYSQLHIIASIRAIYQFFVNPFYWDKTDHGFGKEQRH
jgi:cellulose synthase/poly-beta-1,6-N-acetylglucosamine synthase-like glycosyltransferase